MLVPLNPDLRSYDAGHILRDCATRAVIAGPGHEALFQELQAACPALDHLIVTRRRRAWGACPYSAAVVGHQRPADAAGDITNVYYTSGTTGPPKGCMVDHEYWLRFAGLITDLYGFTQLGPAAVLPSVLLQRPALAAAAVFDRGHIAGSHAPVQRLPLLGCGAREPGHCAFRHRGDSEPPAQGATG